jgi:putative transposase
MKQKKAYKYRFYPSDRQKRILAQTFGCCRYVYNWALRQRTDVYYQHGERLYYEGTAGRLVTLKKQEETAGLNEVSSVPLQQALRNLDKAFRNFFEGRADYPAFKKKRNQQSATYASNAFIWKNQALTEDIKPLEVSSKTVGLDLGLKSMVITSDGHTYGNPKFFSILGLIVMAQQYLIPWVIPH